MKKSLLVWLVVQSLLVAAVAVFLAVDGRRQSRAAQQRTQALEERLQLYEKRLGQAEAGLARSAADLAKARGEFTADLARVRETLARQRDVLRRLVGEEFVADFSNCYFWRQGSPDFDFAPVMVRTGKTTTAVSSNGTRYSLTLSADAATLALAQENRGSARTATYVRAGDATAGRPYTGSYRFNGAAPAGAEGYVLLQPTADDPLTPLTPPEEEKPE